MSIINLSDHEILTYHPIIIVFQKGGRVLNINSKCPTALRVSDITSVYTVFSSKVIKTRPDS